MNSIDCYSDASYMKEISLSIIGYKIGDNDIIIEELRDIKNTQAELIAVERIIEFRDQCMTGQHINIHTDCQRAVQNDYLNATIIKIKGHKKKILRDNKDEIFRTVDKAVRQRLREKAELLLYKNNMN